MRAINCPRCGRLFNKILSPVCTKCEKQEEEQFKELRLYVEDNPFANINEISDHTGVPVKRILQYIREGRLIASAGLSGELRCASCGVEIDEGNFCATCATKMSQDLAGAFGTVPAPAKEQAKKAVKKGSGFHTR